MADLDEILKPENNVDYLYQPLPSIRDQQIRELIQSALEGRSLSSLASRITSHHADALSVFSERMASLAVRQGNPALLVLGLVALVLAGLDSDSGDYETVQILPLHYRSAEKLGVSPANVFKRAVRIVGKPGSRVLRGYLKRGEKDLRSMGYRESDEESGLLYERAW